MSRRGRCLIIQQWKRATSGRSAGTSRGNTRGESATNGTGHTQLADSGRSESGSLDSNDSGRTGGRGSSTTVNKTAAGGTTTVTATTVSGNEQANFTINGNGTFQTQFGGPLKIDLTGDATAGGQGESSVTRTTAVRAPASASRETVPALTKLLVKFDLQSLDSVKRTDVAMRRHLGLVRQFERLLQVDLKLHLLHSKSRALGHQNSAWQDFAAKKAWDPLLKKHNTDEVLPAELPEAVDEQYDGQ